MIKPCLLIFISSNISRIIFGRSIDWGGEPGGNCYNETKLISNSTYWGSDCRKSIMQVIDEVLSKTKVPITFLNITQLSNYRRDAHTSIYKKQWSPLTQEQLDNPVSYADCVHWCLPGLQDNWNELLFAKLFYPWESKCFKCTRDCFLFSIGSWIIGCDMFSVSNCSKKEKKIYEKIWLIELPSCKVLVPKFDVLCLSFNTLNYQYIVVN